MEGLKREKRKLHQYNVFSSDSWRLWLWGLVMVLAAVKYEAANGVVFVLEGCRVWYSRMVYSSE